MLTSWYLSRLRRSHWPDHLPAPLDNERLVRLSKITQLIIPSISLCYESEPVVGRFFAVQDQTMATRKRVLQIAASMAESFPHGIFRALIAAAKDTDEPLRELEVDQISEYGLIGRMDRTWYVLGDAECLRQEQIDIGVSVQTMAAQFEQEGRTVLLLAQKQPKRLLGIFAVHYTALPEAVASLQHMQQIGIECVLLSSFPQHVARSVSRELRVPIVQSELSQEDKREVVHALLSKRAGTALVLDGRGGGTDTYISADESSGSVLWVGSSEQDDDQALLSVHSLAELDEALTVSRELLEQLRRRLMWSKL